MTRNIHEFKSVTDALGIDVNHLGCVMLNLDLVNVTDDVLHHDDLYTSPNPDHWWIDGNVMAKGAHTTLLYGLLVPAWREDMAPLVRQVMAGWEPPLGIVPNGFEVFPSPFEDEPYGCVVALLDDPALRDAHARLSYLPHVDTHPEYRPHATVAYVHKEVAQDWTDLLNINPPVLTVAAGDPLDLGKRS